VIGGEGDIFTPSWMAEEIVAELPRSEMHLYPDSGHAFHWENLEDFNQRVIDFIQSNS
jgi:pimeloyl-ACP methyl ester carboxylesterase